MKLSKTLNAFLLALIMALLWSCKPRELPKEKEVVTVTKIITETKRDTILKVEADSSFYEALIECQNGKPVLTQPTIFNNKPETNKITAGKNLESPKVLLDENGKLKISCQYLANQLKITLKDKLILEQKLGEKSIILPPEIIEKELSWWQKLFIGVGKGILTLVLIFLVYKIVWKVFIKP